MTGTPPSFARTNTPQGPTKVGPQALGRSRGALSTEPHFAVDKGCDANALVETIEASCAQTVIPPRSTRITPRIDDRQVYRRRNLIERLLQ